MAAVYAGSTGGNRLGPLPKGGGASASPPFIAAALRRLTGNLRRSALKIASSNNISDSGQLKVTGRVVGLMRILLVDDNQYALEALTTLLQLKGHEVCPAMTVREALGLAQRKRCDLLIADLGLPDGTAMDLMRELRSMYPLSGIVLSGHDEEEYRAQSRAAGFSRYLVKPIRFTALEAAIAGIGTAERQRLA